MSTSSIIDTSTTYLGLTLRNPIVVASCGLTSDIENLKKIEEAGAGAVVLGSIFEESIIYHLEANSSTVITRYDKDESYQFIRENTSPELFLQHLEFVRKAKAELSIPVIASITCHSFSEWINCISLFEEAGADAVELTLAIQPYSVSLHADDIEQVYRQIATNASHLTSLPIALKINNSFTAMANSIQQISWCGAKGITLFGKNGLLDFDTEKLAYLPASPFSAPEQFIETLRWVTLLSQYVRCDIAASNGIFYPYDVVKALLAGASAVQVVSCLYCNGIKYIKTLNDGLIQWMQSKDLHSIDQFKASMARKKNQNFDDYLRTLFMKNHFKHPC